MLNSTDIANRLTAISVDISRAEDELVLLTQDRTVLESFVADTTEPGSTLRAATEHAGTLLSVAQGQGRRFSDTLNNAIAAYRTAALS